MVEEGGGDGDDTYEDESCVVEGEKNFWGEALEKIFKVGAPVKPENHGTKEASAAVHKTCDILQATRSSGSS